MLALVLAGALRRDIARARSGFLAVFIAGLVGDERLPTRARSSASRARWRASPSSSSSSLLGLTIPSARYRTTLARGPRARARPCADRAAALVLLMLGLRAEPAERAFIAWSGLKGAVPILLAAFALLDRVDGAEHVYGVVFVVVLVSVVGQGTLVPLVARRSTSRCANEPSLPWELSVRRRGKPQARPRVRRTLQARERPDNSIRDLPLGEHAWVTLVVKDGVATRPGRIARAASRVIASCSWPRRTISSVEALIAPRSQAGLHLDPARVGGGLERRVVAVVLVGVASANVASAGRRRRSSRGSSRSRPGRRSARGPARASGRRSARRPPSSSAPSHRRRRSLRVPELAEVEVSLDAVEARVRIQPSIEVARRLHQPLALDDPLPVVPNSLLPRNGSSTEACASFIWRNSGSRRPGRGRAGSRPGCRRCRRRRPCGRRRRTGSARAAGGGRPASVRRYARMTSRAALDACGRRREVVERDDQRRVARRTAARRRRARSACRTPPGCPSSAPSRRSSRSARRAFALTCSRKRRKSSSTSTREYQTSIVRIAANSAIASR